MGLEATIDDNLEWTVTFQTDVGAATVVSALALLSGSYGRDWIPPFGVYEPNLANAAARAAVDELGGEILEELPDPDTIERRVY